MSTVKIRRRKFTFFIGVDISRNKLDLAVRDLERILFHKEITNEHSSIVEFIAKLKQIDKFRLSKAVFCMEDSGFYANFLLNLLRKLRAHIHLGNPLKIKNSLGLLRDKSDKLDAMRIANYAYRYCDELKLWEPRRKEISRLAALSTVRSRLITTIGMIRTPLKEQSGFIDRNVHKHIVECCSGSLRAMIDDLNLLEKSILNIIRGDARLSRLYDIICSVPYVGPVTAVQIIICTNEFLDISCPRKFACYSGVAPFKQESGLTSGKVRAKISQIANRKIKTLLHICAVGCIRRAGEFRAYYDRRCAEGKPQLTVINAIRNKIIRRIFACIKHDRLYLTSEEMQNMQDQPAIPTGLQITEPKQKKRTKFACRTYGNFG